MAQRKIPGRPSLVMWLNDLLDFTFQSINLQALHLEDKGQPVNREEELQAAVKLHFLGVWVPDRTGVLYLVSIEPSDSLVIIMKWT